MSRFKWASVEMDRARRLELWNAPGIYNVDAEFRSHVESTPIPSLPSILSFGLMPLRTTESQLSPE